MKLTQDTSFEDHVTPCSFFFTENMSHHSVLVQVIQELEEKGFASADETVDVWQDILPTLK